MQSDNNAYCLHKISPLFILIDNIKKLILPALLALVSSRGSYWEYFALAFAALISLGAIVQYRFYRYWLDGDKIRVKEGIFFRNVRQVPYKRIQNLNLVQNPLHRLFGVVKVQLESASGGKPEAVINVIDMQAVRELNQRIHGQQTAEEQQVETEQPPPILKLNFGDIVRYGIITNRGLVAVAVFFGFMMQFLDNQFEKLIGSYLTRFASWLDNLVALINIENSWIYGIALGLVVTLVALLCLWALSIVMALLKFHDFTLHKKKDKLQATMGLLTRLQATIPINRVQSLTVHNSLLHRWFKRIGITVETAGGVNTEQQGISMKQVAPIALATEQTELLDEIQSDVDWQGIEWQPLQARAWKRVFKVVFLIGAVPGLLLITVSPLWYPVLLLGWGLYSYYYAKAYIRSAGYCINDQVIAFKDGVIFSKETYVRLAKTQTIQVKESPFDRHHGMAKLEVDTAGAAIGSHHIDIPYLALDEAQAIQQQLMLEVKNSRFQW